MVRGSNLNVEVISTLTEKVSKHDVYRALMDMQSYKAPGPLSSSRCFGMR